ncbi:MAG: YicC family protein [Planctomycetaceae bacterium]|nr:YicC family protein [Planctomycetaceae bacterium]
MLLSMTGFGESHHQETGLAVGVEVRTINSRYFKLTVRSSEVYAPLEAEIETIVRQHVKRGTVQVSLRVDRAHSADHYRLNETALAAYRDQLERVRQQWKLTSPLQLEALLQLPGVVEESALHWSDADADWPHIKRTLAEALERLSKMRLDEGAAMAADLRANAAAIGRELESIAERAPLIGEAYRTRLTERLERVLAEYQQSLDPGDLIKEVSIYAERTDISEEIVRLRSHLAQFDVMLGEAESSGRKLEFLTQEMFREANTIGSKANDVQIARHVIEIKAAIERIREMIQNIE